MKEKSITVKRFGTNACWVTPLTSKAALTLAANHEESGNQQVANALFEYAIQLESIGK